MATSAATLRPQTTHLWLAACGLLVALACLLVLAAAMLAERPAPVRVDVPTAVTTPAPRPDDAAVLLNNTPLAIARPEALAVNIARPVDLARLTPARPFPLGAAGGAALDCLAQAVYYEAASESDRGERAVAQVVLNRVRNPLFPKTVCGVVFQGSQLPTGCQFSFTCDGSLARRPSAFGWARARRIALAALTGWVEASVGLSTHYHADYVVPYWASSLDKAATIGAHVFYVMRGGRGRAAAFTAAYDAAAEGAPTLAIAPGVLDALSAAETTLAAPRDRTVVAEDALGVPSAAVPVPPSSAGGLRADEAAGELLADRPSLSKL